MLGCLKGRRSDATLSLLLLNLFKKCSGDFFSEKTAVDVADEAVSLDALGAFGALGALGGRGGASVCEPYSQQSWHGHIGAVSTWRPAWSCDGCGLVEKTNSRDQ